MEQRDRHDITEALSLMPDVSVGRTGMRNEAIVQVRGFDLRQIPLFVDGIPVYLPYEGTVDTGRFLTFSASEISVSRGFSPVSYGPNTLGGAINVVSRRPTRPVEAVARGGVFSGNGWKADCAAG
jgi:iron complex outermembrane receptor protein